MYPELNRLRAGTAIGTKWAYLAEKDRRSPTKALGSTAGESSGENPFRPMYAGANIRHPSRSIGLPYQPIGIPLVTRNCSPGSPLTFTGAGCEVKPPVAPPAPAPAAAPVPA